jgi:hypothetical protein
MMEDEALLEILQWLKELNFPDNFIMSIEMARLG